MLMVSIGIMLMRVCHRFMMMGMRMNGARRHRVGVYVLVMRIMGMLMLVIHRPMDMSVDVLLCKMKPQTKRHQSACGQQFCADVLVQESDGKYSAKERSHRVVSSGPGRTEMA